MKILLDECVPKALAHAGLPGGHTIVTVQEAGWTGRNNGDLLELAEREYDVLITLDTNIQYQQNLSGRRIAIIVLRAKSNRLAELLPLFPACIRLLATISPGEIIYVSEPL